VEAAVATVRGDTPARQRLVAYVVPRDRTHLAAARAISSMSSAERAGFKLARTAIRNDLGGDSYALGGNQTIDKLPPRRSVRGFERTPVDARALGRLLESLRCFSVARAPLPKYRYPSAGSTYGVQTYLYVRPKRVEGLAEGIYYHHPERHELLRVSDATMDRKVHAPVNHELFEASAFTLFLVGQPKAVEPLYGPLTDRFLMLEAGYIGQLLMTEAPECGLGLCPIGDVEFAAVSSHFHLDSGQACLHALVGGTAAADAYALDRASEAPSMKSGSIVDELQRSLREKLPDYMVPAVIELLESLPLSANGKVDRKRLPEPTEAVRADATAGDAAPSGDVETRLAAIVCEILRVPRVSANANWFELGGTSMTLVSLHLRLHEVFDTDVRLVEIFQYPSVAALARRLTNAATETGAATGRTRAELRRSLAGRGKNKP
jgi:SagB-type dehydrogenase family enzyme